MQPIMQRLKQWYEGPFVPHENDPSSPLQRIGGQHRPVPAARAARAVVEFYLANWKWCLGVAGAGVALLAQRLHHP